MVVSSQVKAVVSSTSYVGCSLTRKGTLVAEPSVAMIDHDNGFSHSRGLWCHNCHPDDWPAWTNRQISDLFERIKALPPDGATGSRDYGRGYAQAVRDALAQVRGLVRPARANGDPR